MVAFENGDGAVVMTNGARGGEPAREIMHSIATEYDWSAGQPKTRKRTTVAPHVLEKLDGTYEFSPKFLINILKVGDRLFAQATGQDRYEIFPASDRDFFFTAVDAVLTFEVEKLGPCDAVDTSPERRGPRRKTHSMRSNDERRRVTAALPGPTIPIAASRGRPEYIRDPSNVLLRAAGFP
jgi:hypothetical protein